VSFSPFDHQCMATALKLAARGLFSPHPNPRVGCVITKGQNILGRGWHEFAGGPHAEIAALRDAREDVKGSTAYITLEPCSHHGRTPPCTEALLSAGISRVVVASADPDPQVNGQGVKKLRNAGLTVDTGLMADQAEALNPGFFMRIRKGRPWVRVKSAISLDGRTALLNGESKWISSEASRRDVQKWRARSAAVLTGIGTVLADNPAMNVRLDRKNGKNWQPGQNEQNWQPGRHGQDGQAPSRQPLRIIADSRWRIPPGSRILADPATAIIAGTRDVAVPPELAATGAQCISLPARAGRTDLVALFSRLAEMELNEIQVEAGAHLCGALLKDRLVDELLIYQAPQLLGEGGPGPFNFGPLESMDERTHLKLLETRRLGNDLRLRLEPRYRN
jgi:diaminohydroxyphosphoribosylaminopyrimidine deaminase/5-amino-6-(5-phosphoribosylamino)uracil reductase